MSQHDEITHTSWTSEGVAFLRRVMGGEVYTGTSGEALAKWAVGITDRLTDRPYDRGDLARCMNIYWSAPIGLRPMIRDQIERWNDRLRQDAKGDTSAWRTPGRIDFEVPRYYRRWDNLSAYWEMR